MAAYPLLLRVPCANTEVVIDGEISPCPKPALIVCEGCFLAQPWQQYCGRECQSGHLGLHKKDCNSPLMKDTWRPSWAIEKRQPSFITDDGPMWGLTSHGQQKYLWGNVPAFDVLNHSHNEVDLPKDLHLLFAASGDIRNVAKSVVGIPRTYTGACEIIINDRDFDIVARNIILLLVALHLSPDEAPPIMLHMWYSALVPTKMVSTLQDNIAPLIRDVCVKIRDKGANSLQRKTWKYGTRSLRVVLQKSRWESLLSYFEVPDGLSPTKAQNIRRSTTLAPERRDYVDRALYLRWPPWRVSMKKFRDDGILLPFGASSKEFDTPNPTFYQTSDFWPMMDSADPLEGWPTNSVIEKALPAKGDIYGGLFLYVQELLMDFCQNVHTLDVNFQLFHLNATDLPSILKESSMNKRYFDRIEVSNIADYAYLGPKTTLATFGPMLKHVSDNPHATMVTLFLNAVHEATTVEDHMSTMKPELEKLRRYLPLTPAMLLDRNASNNPDFLKLIDARTHFRDFDRLFERYMLTHRFEEIGKAAGLEMKSRNTIIKPWPMRLSSSPTQDEFDISLASGHLGSERYVEWKSLA